MLFENNEKTVKKREQISHHVDGMVWKRLDSLTEEVENSESKSKQALLF